MKKIFATESRRKILDECSIKWKFDQDLNFVFDSEEEERKAIKILRNALEL